MSTIPYYTSYNTTKEEQVVIAIKNTKKGWPPERIAKVEAEALEANPNKKHVARHLKKRRK